MNLEAGLGFVGGIAFGAVVGWLTYFIVRRVQPKALSDLTTIIGILGGAAITGLFDPKGTSFAGYAIGLAIGFFVYYAIYLRMVGSEAVRSFLKKELEKGGPVILGRERPTHGKEGEKDN